MANQFDMYVSLLQNAGYRMTEQRQKICRYLAETSKHPTPYEVYSDLREYDPAISRATVYNTLNTLQQLGGIVEINFGADHKHYDTDPTPHINLICLRCHTIEDNHDALLLEQFLGENPLEQNNIRDAITAHNFRPIAMKVDVLGLCKRCQQTEGAA